MGTVESFHEPIFHFYHSFTSKLFLFIPINSTFSLARSNCTKSPTLDKDRHRCELISHKNKQKRCTHLECNDSEFSFCSLPGRHRITAAAHGQLERALFSLSYFISLFHRRRRCFILRWNIYFSALIGVGSRQRRRRRRR